MPVRVLGVGLVCCVLVLAFLGIGGPEEPGASPETPGRDPASKDSAEGVRPVAATDGGPPVAHEPGEIEMDDADVDEPAADMPATAKVAKSDAEWRKLLTPEQYHVTREAGTERAFTGKYWDTKTAGTYQCVCCGLPLFTSDAKFDSGCGWPSFFEPEEGFHITEHVDTSYGMRRVEVRCKRCEAHLGHVFEDGPKPTGLRYCINSASIELVPTDGAKAEDTSKTKR